MDAGETEIGSASKPSKHFFVDLKSLRLCPKVLSG